MWEGATYITYVCNTLYNSYVWHMTHLEKPFKKTTRNKKKIVIIIMLILNNNVNIK